MQSFRTEIPDVVVLEPKVFSDDRGFFFESYNERVFNELIGRSVRFVQDNHSHSRKGVLRGLHYQVEEPQGKLVRVLAGHVFDVAVDMRKESQTFGKWVGVELSAENRRQIWIPEGFAHGFFVMSDFAELAYKTTSFYAPKLERTVRWDDPEIGITWPSGERKPQLSNKDECAQSFVDAEKF